MREVLIVLIVVAVSAGWLLITWPAVTLLLDQLEELLDNTDTER